MKKNILNKGQLVLTAIAALVGLTARAEWVYNNSSNDLSMRFDIGTAEAGDEIVLAGTARVLTNFSFEYWAQGLTGGDEKGQVRFYKNDGAGVPADPINIKEPSTLFFDSGLFSIHNTDRVTLTWDQFNLENGNDLNLSGPVPDSFTWSIQFYNVDSGSGESAGVDLYNPPDVGGNYMEYWNNDGGGWVYSSLTNSGGVYQNVNFGATFGVPEPTSLLLGLAGGLAILGLTFHRRNR
jgi:hypothetical protein